MKKTVSVIVCTLFVLAGFALIAQFSPQTKNNPGSHSSENQVNFTSNTPSSQENGNLPTMTSEAEGYVVREYDGKIGLFKNGEANPFDMVEVEVASLPKTDQLLLSSGIHANTLSELQQLVEDYES